MLKANGFLHYRQSFKIAIWVLAFLVLTFSLLNASTLNAQNVAYSWRLPLDGEWFAPHYQGFGYLNAKWKGYHLGEDVWRDYEATVYAAANGKVRFSGLTSDKELGRVVVIEHILPDGNYVCSVYWHLSEKGLISANTDVVNGQIIGYIETDMKKYPKIKVPHLHFGIRSGHYSEEPDPDSTKRVKKWRYRGYGPKEIVDLWYSPSHFITDTLIIDEYTPFFEKYGPREYWKEKPVGYNWHMYWTYANDKPQPDCYGIWNLNTIRNYREGRFKEGLYEVFAFIPSAGANSKSAKYEIKHNGKASYVIIDQSKYGSIYPGEWVSLGTFDFSGKGDEYVRLDNNTGEHKSLRRMLGYDAIIFEYRPVSSWAKTYGGTSVDQAYSIQQTSDGGYIVAGDTYSFGAGSYDMWVLKLNSNGDVIWQKTYGGASADRFQSMQQTSDGGYILAGFTDSFGTGRCDIWLLKLDSNGSVIWEKTYGAIDDPECSWGSSSRYDYYSIQETSDGGYILGGRKINIALVDLNWWVLKLDNEGNVIWQKTYMTKNVNNDGYPLASSIQQTRDGGYIVVGETSFYSYGYDGSDILALKLDGNGNVVWQKRFGIKTYDWVPSIKQTSDGGYIIGFISCDGYNPAEISVLKLDNSGNVLWQKSYKTYGYGGFAHSPSIYQTKEGGYIIASGTDQGAGHADMWVSKLDSNGNVIWQKAYGGDGFDIAHSIQQTSDGGYVVAGETESFVGGGLDFWILKLDSNGDIPDCPIIGESNAIVNDTNAIITDTNLTWITTEVIPQESAATVLETDATVTEICPY